MVMVGIFTSFTNFEIEEKGLKKENLIVGQCTFPEMGVCVFFFFEKGYKKKKKKLYLWGYLG